MFMLNIILCLHCFLLFFFSGGYLQLSWGVQSAHRRAEAGNGRGHGERKAYPRRHPGNEKQIWHCGFSGKMRRLWLPSAQQALLLVSVRTHVSQWLPVAGKGWFYTAFSLAQTLHFVHTVVVCINRLFPFGFIGSHPSPDDLQTDSSGGPAEKTGSNGTNL